MSNNCKKACDCGDEHQDYKRIEEMSEETKDRLLKGLQDSAAGRVVIRSPQVQMHQIDSNLWQPEFFDVMQVLEMGAAKHGAFNWLEADGSKSSFREMHDSAFHHLARSFAARLDGDRLDDESGLDHLLHAAARVLMVYTRVKRGIKHKED